MNAIARDAREATGTPLYETLWEEPDENRVSDWTDDDVGIAASTTLGRYQCLPASIVEPVVMASAIPTNNIGMYECVAGTAQPLFFDVDANNSFDVVCGSGLISASWNHKRLHSAHDWLFDIDAYTAPKIVTVMYFKRATGLHDAIPSESALPSTHGQREERRATAELVSSIAALLPGLSDSELGALVGVSRLSWRDWRQGLRAARSKKRRQLLRLKRILELRATAQPREPLQMWLETPVGVDLEITPARLLRDGKDQLVATLAARSSTPVSDGYGVAAPLDLGGLETPMQGLDDEAIVRAGYDADDSM